MTELEPMSRSGYDKLIKELARLETEELPEVQKNKKFLIGNLKE